MAACVRKSILFVFINNSFSFVFVSAVFNLGRVGEEGCELTITTRISVTNLKKKSIRNFLQEMYINSSYLTEYSCNLILNGVSLCREAFILMDVEDGGERNGRKTKDRKAAHA